MVNEIHHGGNVEEIAKQLNIPAEKFKDFSANINPLGLPKSLRKILVQSLSDIETYPDPSYSDLKKAIARHLNVSPDDIFVGNGATQVLDESICVKKASDALVLAPTFGEYERLFARQGIHVHHYKLQEKNNFALSVNDLLQYLKNHPAITVICLTNPNNPSGQLTKSQEIRKVAAFCNRHHCLLILDEAFIDLTVGQQESFVAQMKTEDQVYVIRAATKFFAIPGLRLGYCITKNPRLKELLRRQEDAWSVNALANVFGQNMFADQKYIDSTHEWLNTQQPALYKALKDVSGLKVYPSSTNFFLFRCADANLRQELIQKKIIIRQCDDYPGLGSNYYRVAVKSASDNALLVKALKEVLGSGKQ